MPSGNKFILDGKIALANPTDNSSRELTYKDSNELVKILTLQFTNSLVVLYFQLRIIQEKVWSRPFDQGKVQPQLSGRMQASR